MYNRVVVLWNRIIMWKNVGVLIVVVVAAVIEGIVNVICVHWLILEWL